MVGAAVLAILALWFLLRPSPPSLVLLSFSNLDTNAASTIHTHFAQAMAHPRSGEAWGWLGAVLRIYKFPTQALDCLAYAEKLDPRNPRWPYFQSQILASDQPQVAITKLRRTVALCGNRPETPRLRLAKALAEQGDWSVATNELHQLLKAQPDCTPALLLLAHEALASGRLQDAISLAERCAKNPRTARAAWALLATLLQRSNQPEAARNAAQQTAALPQDPQWPDPFDSEANQRRGDPRDLALTCHNQLASGQLDQASPLIEFLIQNHPQFAESWLLLGRLQILRQQYVAAEQSLNRHLQLDPQSTQGLFQLGTALLRQQKYSLATGAFSQAIRIKPDFGPAYFNLGYALAFTGKSREAIAAFKTSLQLNPEHVETYVLCADLHLRLGERAEAEALLAKADAINPNDPRLISFRAQLPPK